MRSRREYVMWVGRLDCVEAARVLVEKIGGVVLGVRGQDVRFAALLDPEDPEMARIAREAKPKWEVSEWSVLVALMRRAHARPGQSLASADWYLPGCSIIVEPAREGAGQ